VPGHARLVLRGAGADRAVDLGACLPPAAAERAERDANRWIKSLRHARVGTVSLRDRFLLRGDSLWWFAELYLHKRRVVARALRAAGALDAILTAESPRSVVLETRDEIVAHVARQVAARHRVPLEGSAGVGARERLAPRAKAIFHTTTAWLDRIRPARRPVAKKAEVAAFVHSAFWRRDRGEESYLGPLLRALEPRVGGRLHLVGVGPRTNFRARRWSDRLGEFSDPGARALPLTPVELYAGWAALRPSRAVWQARGETRAALHASDDLRALSIVDDLDLWPLVAPELTGVADLQFPWSARAMDEAAAALEALEPRVVVTYAEAGGWGRALVLEARRRGVRSVGVQHGFIYRHWLNYLHEPDEMAPSVVNPADRGFPHPDCTLLHDGFAREHLESAGGFPPETLSVTGSPRMEWFLETAERLGPAERERIRAEAGVQPGAHVVLVAAKYAQLGRWFAALVASAAVQPGLVLLVKPHPAESEEPYLRDARGAPHVHVAPASSDLALLTAVARVVVTANSTAAIEAMPIGVPALVVGLPTNLSPFVEAGAMAGVSDPADLPAALATLVGDEGARDALARGRTAFLERHSMVPVPGASERAAAVVASLARPSAVGRPEPG
jgi:hypothetical protein